MAGEHVNRIAKGKVEQLKTAVLPIKLKLALDRSAFVEIKSTRLRHVSGKITFPRKAKTPFARQRKKGMRKPSDGNIRVTQVFNFGGGSQGPALQIYSAR